MQHSAFPVHRGIDQRVCNAMILRLHVHRVRAYRHIAVMPKRHSLA